VISSATMVAVLHQVVVIPCAGSPHPILLPPVGEKVPGGRLRRIRTGSWSPYMLKFGRRHSMSRLFGVPALAGPDRRKAGHQTSCASRTGPWPECMRKNERGLFMNCRVLPASCRQRDLTETLPTGRRQHLAGGTAGLAHVHGPNTQYKNRGDSP
jgi:hypothetical protein